MTCPPMIAHNLIPGICNYGTLNGEGGFEDVIQLRVLDGEIYPECST